MCQNDTRSNAPGSTISKEVECFDLFAQSLLGLFALNRQALYVGGAVVFSSFADPRQHQCWRRRGWAPGNSWQEATGFNHRSTDVKSAGARPNNMPDSGAESPLHRRKVGGGNSVAESRHAHGMDVRLAVSRRLDCLSVRLFMEGHSLHAIAALARLKTSRGGVSLALPARSSRSRRSASATRRRRFSSSGARPGSGPASRPAGLYPRCRVSSPSPPVKRCLWPSCNSSPLSDHSATCRSQRYGSAAAERPPQQPFVRTYLIAGIPRSLQILTASWLLISACRGTADRRLRVGFAHHEWFPPSRTNTHPCSRRCLRNSVRFIPLPVPQYSPTSPPQGRLGG